MTYDRVFRAIALIALVVGLAEIAAGSYTGAAATAITYTVLTTVPLVWAYRSAAVVAALVGTAVGLQALISPAPSSWLPFAVLLLASYTLTAYAQKGRFAVLVLCAGECVLFGARSPVTSGPIDVLWFVGAWVAVVLLAWTVRTRDTTIAQAGAEAQRTREQSAASSALALAAERSRIARDLHDIVAHGVSVMVTEAASAVLSPTALPAAFDTIELTGQRALSELRLMLNVMRSQVETAATPQPGLLALDGLIDAARAGESAVTINVVGDVATVPAGAGVAAYRILQESLTNARSHAPGSAIDISLTVTDRRLDLYVCNALLGGPRGHARHGVTGMQQRAKLYDGKVTAEAREGCWVVRASLALDLTSSADAFNMEGD